MKRKDYSFLLLFYITTLLRQFLSENQISSYIEHMGNKILPDSEKEIEEDVKKALEYARKKDSHDLSKQGFT